MKIGILTSSRADYGIYRPLLKLWRNDEEIEFEIIAFGQHVWKGFGNTIADIEKDGFDIIYSINSGFENDSPNGIAMAYSNILNQFVHFWNSHKFDLVLALGDRYEMAAAVQAGIPYQIRFAHIHAGEKTLGAIDEIFRHQISLASELHFVSIKEYADRIHDLIGHNKSTTVIGAIGLENLEKVKLLTPLEFKEKWNIDITLPTLFFIVHPETVNVELNIEYANILEKISLELGKEYQLIISLPNSDTMGDVFRTMWKNVSELCHKIKLIEHF
ncbi:MAG: UDP-N-acetylglucosamine 2-epimerase, partial [Bacteroidota bacterium]